MLLLQLMLGMKGAIQAITNYFSWQSIKNYGPFKLFSTQDHIWTWKFENAISPTVFIASDKKFTMVNINPSLCRKTVVLLLHLL